MTALVRRKRRSNYLGLSAFALQDRRDDLVIRINRKFESYNGTERRLILIRGKITKYDCFRAELRVCIDR